MWNIGLKDRIGSLSHSSGVITMQPSVLTIGGRQYRTNSSVSRTIATDITPTSNQLCMIYAVIVSGAVQLRVSALPRSSYLALNPLSELVGAFYADVRFAFGSFVNIDGVPFTQSSIEEGFGLGGGLTGLFNGFPSFSLTNYQWTRSGIWLSVNVRMDSVQANGVSARIPLPRGGLTSIEINQNIGTYAGQNGAGNAGGGSIISLTSTDVAFGGPNLTGQAISAQSSTAVVGTNPTTIVADFRTKISQWSTRPLNSL